MRRAETGKEEELGERERSAKSPKAVPWTHPFFAPMFILRWAEKEDSRDFGAPVAPKFNHSPSVANSSIPIEVENRGKNRGKKSPSSFPPPLLTPLHTNSDDDDSKAKEKRARRRRLRF